jgi:P27 family predicted phage terminase small subunit
MGKRGPAPKPTILKLIEGNKGKRKLNRLEPKPDPTMPKCPKHLDKVAKKEWRVIALELSRLGLLTLVDRAALAAYCQTYSRWVSAENMIKSMAEKDPEYQGLMTAGERGFVTNPLVKISRDCLGQMKVFLCEFGLTPSSRTRLEVKSQEEKSLEELLA